MGEGWRATVNIDSPRRRWRARGSDACWRINPGGFTDDDAGGSGHGIASNQGATGNEFGPLIRLHFTLLYGISTTKGDSTLLCCTTIFTIGTRALEDHQERV